LVWVVGIDAMYNSVELDQVGAAVHDAAHEILELLASSGGRAVRGA
jgi:hypothetical protein